jgi:sugar/nucleoside kinase (ribokinase family)
MNSKQTLDFLAIGDIVVDDFVALSTDFASVLCDNDNRPCTLSMDFGQKLPYLGRELVNAVGNSPNASVSASRLGLASAVMTHVGDDKPGKECISALVKEGVSTDFITTEAGKETNYHIVLRHGPERTILIKHAAFKYDLKKQLEGNPETKWAYFSSVAEDSIPYHHEIATWVKENNIKLAFQPGTFQISLGYAKLKDIYEATEVFFCNVEEARDILAPVIGESARSIDVKTILKEFHKLGPAIVCITDGADGAYTYDGNEAWFMPIHPDPKPPVDRTGAGDSFSSTFTSALALGESIKTAITWGPINSMSVVQHVGAQKGLLSREELLQYLANAPADYVPKKLEM